MDLFDRHPHRDVLGSVERPARYAGPEYGAVRPREGAEVSLVLAFPDLYEVGCSNLGLTILYRRASAIAWLRVERAFAPWPDYAAALEERGHVLCSRESATRLGAFDVLGFTLQHELTYTTALWMLELASIPIRSCERDGTHPLVIAGGPCTTNPEPLAAFVDAFAPGDGEASLAAILDAVREAKASGIHRPDLLARLSSLGHVYVPCLYEPGPVVAGRTTVTACEPSAPMPVKIADPAPLGGEPVPVPVVPSVETVFDRVQVEIARGCSGGCRFCHAGMVYRPVRERSPGEIIEAAVGQVVATGYDEISLSSLSAADHPALGRVVGALGPLLESRRVALGVASLRAYGLDASVLEAIHAVRATGMTLAPEAGTERLRAAVNKTVTRDDLLAALERMRGHGWQKVKLYFMVGLPGERDEDLEALADLACEAARLWHGGRSVRGRRLLASVSNFVPKPFTPFEREVLVGPSVLTHKARLVRRRARGAPVELTFHDPWQSWIEGLIARAGREMCDVLERALGAGCRLDAWSEHFEASAWRDVLDGSGLDASLHAASIDAGLALPWDVIRIHVDADHLLEEGRRARRAEATERCDSPLMDECRDCGAPCDPEQASLARGDDSREGIAAARAILRRAEQPGEGIWGPEQPGSRHFVSLTFDRVRSATYLGHRDVIRIVGQCLRRACVPLRYSEGFTPRPRLVFRSALPVGVVGLDEEVCSEVTRPLLDARALVARLAGSCPDGIVFTSARDASRAESRRVGRGPGSVVWYVVLSGDEPLARARHAIEGILSSESLPRDRLASGRHVSVDLRPLIGGARAALAGEIEDLARSSVEGACPVVVVEAVPSSGRWIRPSELAGLLEERGVATRWLARRLLAPERAS